MSFFLNSQIFKMKIAGEIDAETNANLSVQSQVAREHRDTTKRYSITDISKIDDVLVNSKQFEISTNNDNKRTFTINKQKIVIAGVDCLMLLITEQTAFFQLMKEKRYNVGIKFANSCISKQILEPLEIIDQYVEFLCRKLEQRPEIITILNAIVYCSRMIQFSILDLQAISNITNQLFNVKKEKVDMREAVEEVINGNRLQANKKKQKIYTNFDESVPRWLISDRTRIQQIVNNLLNNAIKFSDEKKRITVELFYMRDHEMF